MDTGPTEAGNETVEIDVHEQMILLRDTARRKKVMKIWASMVAAVLFLLSAAAVAFEIWWDVTVWDHVTDHE